MAITSTPPISQKTAQDFKKLQAVYGRLETCQKQKITEGNIDAITRTFKHIQTDADPLICFTAQPQKYADLSKELSEKLEAQNQRIEKESAAIARRRDLSYRSVEGNPTTSMKRLRKSTSHPDNTPSGTPTRASSAGLHFDWPATGQAQAPATTSSAASESPPATPLPKEEDTPPPPPEDPDGAVSTRTTLSAAGEASQGQNDGVSTFIELSVELDPSLEDYPAIKKRKSCCVIF